MMLKRLVYLLKTKPASLPAIICGLFLFCFLTTIPSQTTAETLAEISDSPIIRKEAGKNSHARLMDPKWFVPGSNFHKVFAVRHGAKFLLDWLEIDSSDYKASKWQENSTSEYLYAAQTFTNKEAKQINLKILLPHPKYIDSADMNLVPVFAELRPPKLSVVDSREVDISGRTSSFYEAANGGCSLLIPCNKHTLVVLSVDSCTMRAELLAFTNRLKLAELDKQLDQ